MKSVKKRTKNKRTKVIIPIIILLVVVLAVSATFLIYVYTQNYINLEYIDKAALNIKSDEVSSVSPIIINNVVVGGVSDKGKWVARDNMYGKSNITKGTELDMYNISGKMGTFEIYTVNKDSERNITYAIPLTDITNQEYIAIGKSDTNAMTREMVEVKAGKDDEKNVKKALGKYRFLNNTVKINEVYEVYLDTEQKTRIISATSSGKNTFGVYSVVVCVKGNKSNIVKYSYVKNTESSINWPVYSIKFACDLNSDDKYELVIQEVRELTMKYSILENRGNKYYEVIGLEFNV